MQLFVFSACSQKGNSTWSLYIAKEAFWSTYPKTGPRRMWHPPSSLCAYSTSVPGGQSTRINCPELLKIDGV